MVFLVVMVASFFNKMSVSDECKQASAQLQTDLLFLKAKSHQKSKIV
jgi:hypothetical protein